MARNALNSRRPFWIQVERARALKRDASVASREVVEPVAKTRVDFHPKLGRHLFNNAGDFLTADRRRVNFNGPMLQRDVEQLIAHYFLAKGHTACARVA